MNAGSLWITDGYIRAMGGDLRTNRAGELRHGYVSRAVVTVLIGASPAAVWDVLRRPGSARPEDAERETAFVAPRTSPEAKEVQIAIVRDAVSGQLILGGLVIDEERPPHHVRFHSLEPTPLPRSHSEIDLVQRDAGTEVRYAIAVHFEPGVRRALIEKSEGARHEFMLGQLHGVGQALDAPVTSIRAAVES